MASSSTAKVNYYDDDINSYEDFWNGREYEHHAELMAIRQLLKGKHYSSAMDYGGGYGRVTPTILEFADKVTLVDPSTKQLDQAKQKLKGLSVSYVRQTKKDHVPAKDNSLDLLVMIRVAHHLPQPGAVFKEIARVLKPGGEALIEVASEADFVNRLRYLKKLQKVPKDPVAVGTKANGIEDDTPFVNHNPKTIEALLEQAGLPQRGKLSVSNLRNQFIKRRLSLKAMLKVEQVLQSPLAVVDFGPSIFFLVKKP